MTAVLAFPAVGVLVIAIALALALAMGGQLLVHRYRHAEEFLEHNDVAGFIIAVVGTLYAVVLGFVTVVTWQHYDATAERLALETASVADTWHNAVGLPPGVRTIVRRDMMRYASEMAVTEWPLMRQGRFSPLGDELIMDATSAVGGAAIGNASQSNAQAATLRLLTDLHDDRARRLAGNTSGLSWFEWLVLFVGGFVVIALCWLFGVRSRVVHLIMTGSVAVIVAAMFVLVFELQYPFRSDLGLRNVAWTGLMTHIRMMDASPMAGMRM